MCQILNRQTLVQVSKSTRRGQEVVAGWGVSFLQSDSVPVNSPNDEVGGAEPFLIVAPVSKFGDGKTCASQHLEWNNLVKDVGRSLCTDPGRGKSKDQRVDDQVVAADDFEGVR
jgi:hypothetical protein